MPQTRTDPAIAAMTDKELRDAIKQLRVDDDVTAARARALMKEFRRRALQAFSRLNLEDDKTLEPLDWVWDPLLVDMMASDATGNLPDIMNRAILEAMDALRVPNRRIDEIQKYIDKRQVPPPPIIAARLGISQKKFVDAVFRARRRIYDGMNDAERATADAEMDDWHDRIDTTN
jgi:hypothetical protein